MSLRPSSPLNGPTKRQTSPEHLWLCYHSPQRGEMFHFSHTMEAQLGGIILEAGFVITGFCEDRRTEADGNPIRLYLPSCFVVRARRV